MPNASPVSPMMSDSLTRGLCCAALDAGLGSVLVFDLSPDELPALAGAFAQMIAAASGQTVRPVLLSTNESEDGLWGGYVLSSRDARMPLVWQPGLLTPADDDGIRLLAIPDLERISPTVARALVATVGADVVQVERYGNRRQGPARFYWLAGCAGNAAGRISPHLLDRFALRLQARRRRRRAADLLAQLNLAEAVGSPTASALAAADVRRLRSAAQRWPTLSEAATERVLEYEAMFLNPSPRRGIALSRLAHALARLEAADEAGDEHIDEAARLIGLSAPAGKNAGDQQSHAPEPLPRSGDEPAVAPEGQASPEPLGAGQPTGLTSDEGEQAPSGPVEQTALSSPETQLPAAPLTAPIDPYREDHQPVEREAVSLRLPFQHSRQTAATRGTIIGTQPARTLHDLALVSTLFESAKFQFARRRHLRDGGRNDAADERRLLIAPSDLRGYRRAPIPEHLLLLLLDYTCLEGRQWLESLLPHFKQAYVDRARVCLIQVGAATTGHWLRAERQFFNSVLVPGLAAALEAPAGKATPLAHGLELALQTMKHALQHGRQTARSARLAVVSDGRGNVPLDASIQGRVENRVGREGIEDALHAARKLRALDRVEITFLDPQPASYAGLVTDLAEALGVIPQRIPFIEPEWPLEDAVGSDTTRNP